MKKSYLFGAPGLRLDTAREVVEKALGVKLQSHESEYRGGDYFRTEKCDAQLTLQTNFMEDDGEVTEAEHPSIEILLYVDGEARDVDLISKLVSSNLDSFKLLRSSSY